MGGGFSSQEPALALLQRGHKPRNAAAQPLWRQITLNSRAGSGKSVALCFLQRIPRWVLPAGTSGSLERLSGAAALHLLRAGRGEQRPWQLWGAPSGTASSRRAPSGAAPSGLTRIEMSLLQHRGKALCMVQVCCAAQEPPPNVPQLMAPLPSQCGQLCSHKKPQRRRFRVAAAFWGEQRWKMWGLGRGLVQAEEQL